MKWFMFTILAILTSVVVYYKINLSVLQLCELETCPICFGTNLCGDIQQGRIALQYNSVINIVFNIFSVKNVYFARYNNKQVVLKKLAHNSELKELDDLNKYSSKNIKDFLLSDRGLKNFKICDEETARYFLKLLMHKNRENLLTLLHINMEPILLELFNYNDGWRVPKLFGFCGRLVVVENAGLPLNHLENFNWFDRAFVAYQILKAMSDFTKNHVFRLYLTDISPDNIVFDKDFQVTFVDLENVILKRNSNAGTPHYSENFDDESYIYSEKQICESSISDHNIYSACKLLLSKSSPWPMMKGGLLHNPPKIITDNFNEVFVNIDLCVFSSNKINRFKLSDNITEILQLILKKYTKHI